LAAALSSASEVAEAEVAEAVPLPVAEVVVQGVQLHPVAQQVVVAR
jgi:hypothetical protein